MLSLQSPSALPFLHTQQLSEDVCPASRFQIARDVEILGILEKFFSKAVEDREGSTQDSLTSVSIVDVVQDLSPEARTRAIWSLYQKSKEINLALLDSQRKRKEQNNEKEIKLQTELHTQSFTQMLIDCMNIDRSVDLMRQNHDSERADRLVVSRKLSADFIRDNARHTFSIEESQLISEYFFYSFLSWQGRCFIYHKESFLKQGGKMVTDFPDGVETLWDNCPCKIPLYPEAGKTIICPIPRHIPRDKTAFFDVDIYLEQACKRLIRDALKLSMCVFEYLSRTQDATCNRFYHHIETKLPEYFSQMEEDSISRQIFAQSSSKEDFKRRYREFIQTREKECLAAQQQLLAEEEKKQTLKLQRQINTVRKVASTKATAAKSSPNGQAERENTRKIDKSPLQRTTIASEGGNWTYVAGRERTQTVLTQDQLIAKMVRQSWNISLSPHVTRWFESKGDDKVIRTFVDKSGVANKYANMRTDEIELQWRYHCVPGLELLLSDLFLKQYAFDYTNSDEAHRYKLWTRLAIPGKQPIKSILTFSIGGNRLFHSYFHPPYEAKSFVENNRRVVESQNEHTSRKKIVHQTNDVTISYVSQEGFEYPTIVLTSERFKHSYSIYPKVPTRSKSFSRLF